ncbi:hypothetical protein DCM91_08310 [Chitinophaga costaii]|nr:hypothetical protein DCM91_08310 [Chitinophaga costaii]
MFIAGYTIGDKLILFFSNRENAVQVYELNVEDGTASLVADLVKPTAEDASLTVGPSSDTSHFYVVYKTTHKNEPSSYEGFIIDKQFKIVTKFVASNEEPDKNIDQIKFIVSDDGIFNIIAAVKGSDTKKDFNPFNYTIIQVNASGKVSTGHLTGIPGGLFKNIAWYAVKNDVQFKGFYEMEKSPDFTTVISGVYDGLQRKVTQIKKTELAQKVSVTASLLHYYTLKDNSTVIMLEPSGGTHIDYVPKPNPIGSSFSMQREPATVGVGNLYMIKITANNEIAWVKTIYKNQLEMNFHAFTGSAILPDNNDGFYIFYQDCLKNTDVDDTTPRRVVLPGGKRDGLAVVHISADGKMTKKFQEPSFNHKRYSGVPFSPVFIATEGGNRLIYVSFKHKNMDRSLYHLSAVTVE